MDRGLRILEIFVLIFILGDTCIGREVTDCYANNENPYLKFGTKTAYEFVYERPKLGDIQIENCEPVQLWMLARHGTRYPGRRTIRNLQQLHDLKVQIIRNHEERKNGRLCNADLEYLRAWSLNVSMADSNMLTQQGKDDLRYLAKRFRTKYPSLFQQGYSQNLFEFRHTASERTRQSAQAFAEGLFGSRAGVWIPPAIENDTVIYPQSNCTKWIKEVEDNPETAREEHLFFKSVDMLTLIHNVSQRLGFLYDLPDDTITSMYDMCRFNKAWSLNERSPWCAAFTKPELKILEYKDDLESYYDSGYGHPLNMKLGCTAVKDMLQRFEQLEDDNIQRGFQPAGIFYFTHRKMIAMTIARLGIAGHGLPLKHYNYDEQSRREWKISDLCPFSANLAAVFFKCSTGVYNRVMFFLNEKRVDYEGCEVGLCSWSYIRNKFSELMQHCDLEWCRNKSTRIMPSVFAILSCMVFNLNLMRLSVKSKNLHD